MADSGDSTAPFFGFIGAAAALVFSSMGAAYGTAKSGVGIAAMGVMRPELVMKSIVPVVMAGVLGIYGFIISVLIAQKVAPQVRVHPQNKNKTKQKKNFGDETERERPPAPTPTSSPPPVACIPLAVLLLTRWWFTWCFSSVFF